MSINWQVDKQLWCNGILHGNKKDRTRGAVTYMILRSITFNERSQTQNVTYCMIPFIWPSVKGKIIWAENRLVLARYWVVGGEDWLQRSRREFLESTEMVYIWIVVVEPWVYASVKTRHAERLKGWLLLLYVIYTLIKLDLKKDEWWLLGVLFVQHDISKLWIRWWHLKTRFEVKIWLFLRSQNFGTLSLIAAGQRQPLWTRQALSVLPYPPSWPRGTLPTCHWVRISCPGLQAAWGQGPGLAWSPLYLQDLGKSLTWHMPGAW